MSPSKMPVLTMPEIANKFKEKWMLLHPEDHENASGSVSLDDSLTSLHWLQNFSILSANPERSPSFGCHPQHFPQPKNPSGSSDSPSSPPAGDTAAMGMAQPPGNPTPACSTYGHPQAGLYGHSGTKYKVFIFQCQTKKKTHITYNYTEISTTI